MSYLTKPYQVGTKRIYCMTMKDTVCYFYLLLNWWLIDKWLTAELTDWWTTDWLTNWLIDLLMFGWLIKDPSTLMCSQKASSPDARPKTLQSQYFRPHERFRMVFTWKHTGVFIWKRICFFCVLDYCSQSKMQSHVFTNPHATTFWKRCVLRRSLL